MALRCISAMTGMGASEQACTCTNVIMPAEQGSLGGEEVESISIMSTAYKLNRDRSRQKQLEDIECSSSHAVCDTGDG